MYKYNLRQKKKNLYHWILICNNILIQKDSVFTFHDFEKGESNQAYEWDVLSDAPNPTGPWNWRDKLVRWTTRLLSGLCLEAGLIM